MVHWKKKVGLNLFLVIIKNVMNWKKSFLNRYTIYYLLWLYFLFLLTLPRAYIVPAPYNVHGKLFLGLSAWILVLVLPIYSIVLIMKDIKRKKYGVAIVNTIFIIFLSWLFLYLFDRGIELWRLRLEN